jgi:maltose-binding protein MalE
LAEEENYGWLFVDTVPLLYDKKKVAKQLQIETWLDLYQLTKELNIQKLENSKGTNPTINYVI